MMHLYAVTPADGDLRVEVAGVDGKAVRAITDGEFAALYSLSECPDYHALSRVQLLRSLLAHQRVVQTAMRHHTVMPARFGTLLPNEDAVRRALAQGGETFRQGLGELAGRVQMEVVATWRLEDVLHEIACEDEVTRLVAKSEPVSSGGSAKGHAPVERMVYARLEQRRNRVRRALVRGFEEMGEDPIVNRNLDASIVADLALLIEDSKRAALANNLDLLGGAFRPRLDFECVGPLPPYSFATIEIEQPDFESIDAARRLLGLEEAADAAEIEAAYRRVAAGRRHVDKQQLAKAYRLLSCYAQSVARRAGTSQVAVCSFDRGAVENTVLISVLRQESQV